MIRDSKQSELNFGVRVLVLVGAIVFIAVFGHFVIRLLNPSSVEAPSNVDAPSIAAVAVETGKIPPELQQKLDVDVPFSATAARAVQKLRRDVRQKLDECLMKNDADVCVGIFQSLPLHQYNADPGNEIKIRAAKRGCALGNLWSCRQYTDTLDIRDPVQFNDALLLHKRNCETTILYECDDLGSLLLRQGKEAEAREAYSKICIDEDSRGCEQWGKLSKTDAQRVALKGKCENDQDGACLAYETVLLQTGQTDAARALMIEHCLKDKPLITPAGGMPARKSICIAAAKLVNLPPDAAAFVGKQQACFGKNGGEYGGPWDKYVVTGLKEPCVDRSNMMP